jgi:SAM-dependent methyltransferase
VTATDLSGDMLKMLMGNAQDQGITNIETRVVDADSLPFEDSAFDLVTSRFGLMFVADVLAALAGMKRVLKPGGKAVFMVWGALEPGSYFGTILVPYVMRLPEKPDPDGPGPIRFAEPDKLAALLRSAGFDEVQEYREVVDAPFSGTPEELLVTTFDLATPFQSIAASLSDEDRAAAESEAIALMKSNYADGRVNVTAPVVIVVGTA